MFRCSVKSVQNINQNFIDGVDQSTFFFFSLSATGSRYVLSRMDLFKNQKYVLKTETRLSQTLSQSQAIAMRYLNDLSQKDSVPYSLYITSHEEIYNRHHEYRQSRLNKGIIKEKPFFGVHVRDLTESSLIWLYLEQYDPSIPYEQQNLDGLIAKEYAEENYLVDKWIYNGNIELKKQIPNLVDSLNNAINDDLLCFGHFKGQRASTVLFSSNEDIQSKAKTHLFEFAWKDLGSAYDRYEKRDINGIPHVVIKLTPENFKYFLNMKITLTRLMLRNKFYDFYGKQPLKYIFESDPNNPINEDTKFSNHDKIKAYLRYLSSTKQKVA